MRYKKNIIRAFTSVALVLLSGILFYNRQNLYDRYVLLSYEPPQEIMDIASRANFTPKYRTVFYANKPKLLDKDAFNITCPVGEETIVLGCYDGIHIYIFNVNDDRLNGIKEVTAAHELLHAGYDRLSSRERREVNLLIEKQLTILNDQRILKNLESYRKKDPSIVINEAHSILGTEVDKLSPELENYYNRYFTNRNAVVKLSMSYESVLTGIRQKVESYDIKLTLLKNEIESREGALSKESEQLISWSKDLDLLRTNSQVNEYNTQVLQYNSRVTKYRDEVNKVRALIREYNGLVEERNKLSLEQNSLYQSMSSTSRDL